MVLTWLKRILSAGFLLALSLVLYVIVVVWDEIDWLRCWWEDLRIQRIHGCRFLVGFSSAPQISAPFPGYRQVYLGRWFLEWQVRE